MSHKAVSLAVLGLVLLPWSLLFAAEPPGASAELTAMLESLRAEAHLPALAAAVLRDETSDKSVGRDGILGG